MRLRGDPAEDVLLIGAEVEHAAAHRAEGVAGLLDAAADRVGGAVRRLRVAEPERVAELVQEERDGRFPRQHHLMAEGLSEEAAVGVGERVDDVVIEVGVEPGSAGCLARRRDERVEAPRRQAAAGRGGEDR